MVDAAVRIYQMLCAFCNHRFEYIAKDTERPYNKKCPQCGSYAASKEWLSEVKQVK